MDKVFELMKFDEQKISNGFSNQVDEIDEARIEGTEIVEGVVYDGMGDTDTPYIKAIQKDMDEYKEDVFWYSDTTKTKLTLAIDNKKLLNWLRKNGIGLLKDGKSNTSSFYEVSLRDGIIDKENRDTMKQLVIGMVSIRKVRLAICGLRWK
mgnify:CR=1 FL=1